MHLIEPSGDDEIFDSDPEALRFAAIMTGDLFSGVRVIGARSPLTVMIAGHPCTIRGAEGTLQPRVVWVTVKEHQRVPYRKWPQGYYNVFPIGCGQDGVNRAADLQEWVTVDSAQLDRTRRELTLTDYGIVALQQRIVHSLTRVVVEKGVLYESMRPILREAELERDWVEARSQTQKIDESTREFARFMDEADRRRRLRDESHESAVRSEVRSRLRESSRQ